MDVKELDSLTRRIVLKVRKAEDALQRLKDWVESQDAGEGEMEYPGKQLWRMEEAIMKLTWLCRELPDGDFLMTATAQLIGEECTIGNRIFKALDQPG